MGIRLISCIILLVVGLSIQSYAQKGGSSEIKCSEVVNFVAYTPSVCSGQSIQLTPGVGGNTYNWTPTTGILDVTSGTPMASPTKTTTYTVTGYTDSGCSYHTFTLTVITSDAECEQAPSATKDGVFTKDTNSDVDIRKKSGKVIIGDSTMNKPGAYRLYVKEGVLTEKINLAIKETSDWADFVFDASYPMPTIDEVAAYTGKFKHLPTIPSAETILANGIDVAKINASLLQNIEELWLHFIEIDNENRLLEAQNKEIEGRINKIKN